MKSNLSLFTQNLAIKLILPFVVTLVTVPMLVFAQSNGISHKGGENAEEAVRQALDDLYTALGRNDAAALDRIYAADYTLINESGELTTKAPRLSAIRSGELKYESVAFSDVSVRTYGDTAIATYNAKAKGQFRGQPIGGELRVTTTFVKIKGRWQLVAAHVTKVIQ